MMEREKVGEKEMRKGMGEVGVAEKESGLLSITHGRTAGGKGDGGGSKDRLICVFVKIEESSLAA